MKEWEWLRCDGRGSTVTALGVAKQSEVNVGAAGCLWLCMSSSLVLLNSPLTTLLTLHPQSIPICEHQGLYNNPTHDCFSVSLDAPVISLFTLPPTEHPPARGPVPYGLFTNST